MRYEERTGTYTDAMSKNGGWTYKGWDEKAQKEVHVGDRGLFSGCSSLKSYSVPKSLGYVGGRMFEDCDSLASVALPATCASVGSYAFAYCDSLASVTLPEGVRSLGERAFCGCGSVAWLSLPASLAEIGDDALGGWPSERYDESRREWVDAAHEVRCATWEQYWKVNSSRYVDLSTTRVLPPEGGQRQSVQFAYTINDDGTITITGCKTSAESVTIPSYIDGHKVTGIGEGAFQNDGELATVVLSETVKTIEENAFAGCPKLGQVLVPASVNDIADSAFDGSDNLTITCDADSNAQQFADAKGIPTTQAISLSFAVARCEEVVPLQGGKAAPEMVVTVGDKLLTKGTDYTVAFANNTSVGHARATLVGTGDYTDSCVVEFIVSLYFADVNSSTAHRDAILWLSGESIASGWTEKDGSLTYRPGNTVKRGDMAAFLFRLAKKWGVVDENWKPSGNIKKKFRDVNASTAHHDAIWWLAEQGISQGWGSGKNCEFRPNAEVKRGDMAAFLKRLADKAGRTGTATSKTTFSDVTSKTAHADDIRWLAATGISVGWTVGSKVEFRPNTNVKRGDMAAFLYRLDNLS